MDKAAALNSATPPSVTLISVTLTCTVCGFQFNPAENPSCGACPLHAGCATACCPNCGTTNINPDASRLATWMKSILRGK